jgi:hypothetical protein
VDHALCVSRGQSVGDGDRDLDGLAPPHRGGHAGAQRVPLQQFRDRVGDASVRADIMNRQNIRMGHRRDRSGFPLEAGQCLGIRGEVLRQDLDRDIPAQPRVPRAVHFPHPACAQRRDDFVGAQTTPGSQ